MSDEDCNILEIADSRKCFSSREIEDLINLIYENRQLLMNKSRSVLVLEAKDECWANITKQFNSMDREQIRTGENLRKKWESIKKSKVFKTLRDLPDSLTPLHNKIITLLNLREDCDNVDTCDTISSDEEMGNDHGEAVRGRENKELENKNEKSFNGDARDTDDEIDIGMGSTSRYYETSPFSIEESKLLLQCLREEYKGTILSKDQVYLVRVNSEAWDRITDAYNKLSPRKRSKKKLMSKFKTMKYVAKRCGFKEIKDKLSIKRNKHEKLVAENNSVFKNEHDYDTHKDDDWNFNYETQHHSPVDKLQGDNENLDPLATVLNSDSGFGSCHLGSNYDAEVAKIKMKLLNYQMETAKLERKRVEDAIAGEAKTRELQEIEQAMRLRSARLEAVAAATRLPPSANRALVFTPEETRAQVYINQYRHQNP